MALFDGVENFIPAFTGQQLAIQAGAAAGNAFTSGMNAGSGKKNAGTSRMNADLNRDQFNFQREQYNDQLTRLKAMSFYLDDGMP